MDTQIGNANAAQNSDAGIDSSNVGPCNVCKSPSVQKCSKCVQVYYCTKEHQKDDWKAHKDSCAPVAITNHPTRYGTKALVATRDIPKGEIIFKEKPLIHGPRAIQEKPELFPICLECCRLVQSNYICTKCEWPLCGLRCEMGKLHSSMECSILADNNVESDMNLDYLGIALLRGLLLKTKNPENWEKLLKLESGGGPEAMLDFPVDFVIQHCKQDHFDETTLYKVAGIIHVNRMSDEGNENGEEPISSSVYYKASFASHSCVPNSIWYIQENADLFLRATIPIKKGELVTTTTVDMERNTLARRDILNLYGIKCECKRCSDPTELGTFMSAIKCSSCTDNALGYYLPKEPLNPYTTWECLNPDCDSSISRFEAQGLSNTIWDEFKSLQGKWAIENRSLQDCLKSIKKEENFLKKYSGKKLHKNHMVLLICKRLLANKIPQVTCYMENDMELERIQLEQKQVAWAKECLAIVDIIWPGYSRHRGQLLYNLQRGMFCVVYTGIEKQERRRCEREITLLQEQFKELLEIRKEVKTILGIERCGKMEKRLADEMDEEPIDFQNVRQALGIHN